MSKKNKQTKGKTPDVKKVKEVEVQTPPAEEITTQPVEDKTTEPTPPAEETKTTVTRPKKTLNDSFAKIPTVDNNTAKTILDFFGSVNLHTAARMNSGIAVKDNTLFINLIETMDAINTSCVNAAIMLSQGVPVQFVVKADEIPALTAALLEAGVDTSKMKELPMSKSESEDKEDRTVEVPAGAIAPEIKEAVEETKKAREDKPVSMKPEAWIVKDEDGKVIITDSDVNATRALAFMFANKLEGQDLSMAMGARLKVITENFVEYFTLRSNDDMSKYSFADQVDALISFLKLKKCGLLNGTIAGMVNQINRFGCGLIVLLQMKEMFQNTLPEAEYLPTAIVLLKHRLISVTSKEMKLDESDPKKQRMISVDRLYTEDDYTESPLYRKLLQKITVDRILHLTSRTTNQALEFNARISSKKGYNPTTGDIGEDNPTFAFKVAQKTVDLANLIHVFTKQVQLPKFTQKDFVDLLEKNIAEYDVKNIGYTPLKKKDEIGSEDKLAEKAKIKAQVDAQNKAKQDAAKESVKEEPTITEPEKPAESAEKSPEIPAPKSKKEQKAMVKAAKHAAKTAPKK